MLIRIRIFKKNRQNNGQMKIAQKDKHRSIKRTYKTKDRVTRTPLKTGVHSKVCGSKKINEPKLDSQNRPMLPLLKGDNNYA